MSSHVTCTVTDGVAEVRLDRPEKLNALTLQILGDLARHTFGRERIEQAWLLAARNTAVARRAASTRLAPEFGPRQR